MITGEKITPVRRAPDPVPSISITRFGKGVLNKAARNLFDKWKTDRVVTYWDPGKRILTVRGFTARCRDADSMKLTKPTRQTPGGSFAAKSLLSAIGWDWSENRGPFQGKVFYKERAIQLTVTRDCIQPSRRSSSA